MQNYCFYSSLLFLINSFLAYHYKYYLYSFFFILLVMTSLIVHSTTNFYTKLVDKFSIYFVVFYGGYLLFTKFKKNTGALFKYFATSFILTTFFLTFYLYNYGYIYDKYSFDKDAQISQLWHSFLHFVSSLGHIMIIIM